ncbi:RING zinc finger-containing protein [Heterostelium album PN500]|uniref:RING zinc finger-containing protein n=1 Tax=Heterostelium pallidum (strain ATCC 26659 / Pp 5 / PN500) TaxID=670386 RepID=D3BAY3_HETP5|nr:RING zinc finger-containing protein [Heterostelium album PN500]EFA81720.1 RING zinc finger-containing protein [Heterostelium album PN500]|eukprot:XP_020433837.1 RING zinc finger-containing protein [Heterostelium album PN500]
MSEVMIDIELLTCPICSDTFVDACDTSCGHTFCEFCLNCCLESKPDKCPVCSKDPSPTHPAFTIRSLCEMIAPVKPKEDDDGQTNICFYDIRRTTLESEKEAGNNCYYANKYAQAISHYNNAIDKATNSSDPKNCVLFNNRAQCYIHLHQYKRALMDCEEAIRLNDTNVKAFMRKGLCLRLLGYFEESKQAYTKALQLDTQKSWTRQIQDGLHSLPIFKPQTYNHDAHPPQQQPQQQQQQQPQQQRASVQYPYQQQQQQQQPMPNYYNTTNGYNQYQYPQFNPNHARYAPTYPPGYIRTNTNPNFSTYYQPQQQQQQAQPQQQAPAPAPAPSTTTTTNNTNNVNNNSNTNSSRNTSTSSTSTSSTSSSSSSSSSAPSAHEKKKSDYCK